MGVFVGHSETILRSSITTDDDQPLWWAKGGTLIGSSPARIAWLRGLQDRIFPDDLGLLIPTQERFGANASTPCAATMLSDAAGSFKFLHFYLNGSFSIPLVATDGRSWTMIELDYWAMTEHVTALNGSAVTINVSSPAPSSLGRPTGVNVVLTKSAYSKHHGRVRYAQV